MSSLRIQNGHIIDPANGIDIKGDVFIDQGKIVSINKLPEGFRADLVIDAKGSLVCPGLVDLSARFREPGHEYKATIASESEAAARTGITTVCCPPDTEPVIDTPAVVELLHHRTQLSNKTKIYPLGALTHGLNGERLAEMHTLKQAGCVGVSNGRRPINNTEVLRRAMEYAASCSLTVHIFAEDEYLRKKGVVHEGIMSTRLGLAPIPETAETVAVSRALLLIEQTGVRAHFCRLSSARSVEMIYRARQAGLAVTADVGICNLFLTEIDVGDYNTNCYLEPPLRTQRDKEALVQALVDGTIDAICSDHQPHDEDAKAAPFAETEPGASTLELLLPLALDLVNKNLLTMPDAIANITSKPAEILGIEAGSLAVGSAADIVIIDPHEQITIDRDYLVSAGKNTPFVEWELTGKATHTILDGQLVYGNPDKE